MMSYCARADIEMVYGKLNTSRWADLDNDGDEAIVENRIDWACQQATAYLNARLMRGPYTIPFETSSGTGSGYGEYPEMIVNLTAMYAGILLYDGRQVVSSDDRDAVSRQRRDFDRYIKQIYRGQLKILDADSDEELTIQAYNAPFIVGDDDEDNDTSPPESV